MRNFLKSWMLLALLVTMPAPCLAEDPPPFQVVYRQQNVDPGEVATKSDLMLMVINRSGAEIRDVNVSAVTTNSYFVINIPIPFENIPDGGQKELLVPAVVPNVDISDDGNEEVVWQLQYTSDTGEIKTLDIVGERGGKE